MDLLRHVRQTWIHLRRLYAIYGCDSPLGDEMIFPLDVIPARPGTWVHEVPRRRNGDRTELSQVATTWSIDYAELGCTRGLVRIGAETVYDPGDNPWDRGGRSSISLELRYGPCDGPRRRPGDPGIIDAGPRAPGIVPNAQGEAIREDGGMGCGGCDAI